MGKEIKEFIDNIANYVSSKKPVFPGPGGLLSDIIQKEMYFLIFLTVVYLITLGIKQRSRTIYKYLVTLTIAVIVLYTYLVSTIFDESIKNGTATQEVLKGLPPISVCLIIKLFKIIPPLKLFYYALPVLMIAYSVYYHNLLSGPSSKSKSKSKSSTGRTRTHSHSHPKTKKKSLKGFIRVSLSLFTDFIHSFILFYAYAVLVLLIFINNNYDYTINSINTGGNAFGKVLRVLDLPFLSVNKS